MAKGPSSISQLAQSQSKMVHKVAGAETGGYEEENQESAEIARSTLGSQHQNSGCSR